ncbi:hypothetical protein M9Y10_022655 [Tritrichomonas musculus]|uniref:Man1/Src1 C-terminal domain-containing protein n=1 Tax=Tritrichomonas musculus TaxID=1915356 RepID=A0ABR2KT89_9EUKA
MTSPNGENQILKPLIDNAAQAKVKPVPKSNGNLILFQRDVDPPAVEQLEDEIDEVNDNSFSLTDDEELHNESNIQDDLVIAPENLDNESNVDINSRIFKNSINKAKKKDRRLLEEGNIEEEEVAEGNSSNFDYQSQKNDHKTHTYEKPKINVRRNFTQSNKSSASSTPKDTSNSTSKRSNHSSLKKINRFTSNYKSKSNYKSSLSSILFYCIVILAILIGIISYVKETEDESLLNNSFELDAVTQLNDCVTPIESIPLGNCTASFIENIKNGSSIYLKIDDETQSIIIKKPYRSLFCKAVDFGDHHPDLCGLFIVWIITFLYFIHYKISRIRAERIAPDVMNLLKSNHMCYIDEAKKKMKESGYWLFGAWWQVKSIISNDDNVKTVKIVDTKPFWSFNTNNIEN